MLSFFNLFMNVAILWSNETVRIPVGESLEQYKYLPEAVLYVDNKPVDDRLMYYEYEINYTSFSVVRTHLVGTYTVWYRVHFPSVGFESDVAIKFEVFDHIAPVITGAKDYYVNVQTKSIDYKTLINYKDNYDENKNLILTIDSAQVNLNQVGIYQVSYKVMDKAFNESIFIQNIHVEDRVKPTIKQKAPIVLNIGDALDIYDFFTLTDNYDSVLNVVVFDENINYQKPGMYPLTLHVSDQSGNMTSLDVSVTVIDHFGPQIILKTNHIKISYKDPITKEDFKDFVLSVEDNVDRLSIEDVSITSYVQTDILGTYEVIFSIKDTSGLIGEAKMRVDVVDDEAPQVILNRQVIVPVHTLEPYIFDYITLKDNYDSVENLKVTKTGTVTMSKIGSYRLIIKVTDQSQNMSEFPIIVEVIDDIAPTLHIVERHTIHNFLRPDYEAMIISNDNYDKDVAISIDDAHIDYSIIGHHVIEIKAADSSGNTTTKEIQIDIKDSGYPEIILKTQSAYIAYGTDEIDYLSFVESVYDSYDKTLKITDIDIETSLDMAKVGLYQVIYEIKDSSQNSGIAILYIYLNDYEKPHIEARNITIKSGTSFNYFDYVTAFDNYDGDISHMVKMNPTFVPNNQPGHYEIIFYVHDTSGNYAETKILLTIEATTQLSEHILYILGGITILIGITLYYLYRKKREKF